MDKVSFIIFCIAFHEISVTDHSHSFCVVLRRKLHQLLPSVFASDPMDEVAKGGKLSEAYHRMSKLGIIQKVRHTNDSIIRRHFEKKVGMVRDEISSARNFILYGVPVACAIFYCYKTN